MSSAFQTTIKMIPVENVTYYLSYYGKIRNFLIILILDTQNIKSVDVRLFQEVIHKSGYKQENNSK